MLGLKHISITTDFASSVGAMRGVIWNIAPDAKIADNYTAILPQDVNYAAWYLDQDLWYFPLGSIHIVDVDPGKPKLQIGDRIITGVCETFGESESGELIVLYGTAGYIIVAVVNGSAYEILRPKIGGKVRLTY